LPHDHSQNKGHKAGRGEGRAKGADRRSIASTLKSGKRSPSVPETYGWGKGADTLAAVEKDRREAASSCSLSDACATFLETQAK